jgi:putative endonuclease
MQPRSTSLACGSMGPVPFIAEALSRWRSFFSRWIDAPAHRTPGLSHKVAALSTSGRKPEAAHLSLGRDGEKLAARHLRRNGYRILHRNFRHRAAGEIDLVCRHGTVLVFVEVKTRSREDFGRPFDAIDRKKRRRIQHGAMAWLRMLDMPDITFRFDAVEVIAGDPPEIRVIENAFALPTNYYY